MRLRTIVPLAALWCIASTAALCAQSSDSAATFPWRPIRLVSGFTAGGPPDTIGRILAAKLTELLGQQGIVDNRPGAGGTTGTKIVAEATPDGHTLPDVQNHYAALGVDVSPMAPAEFDKFVDSEITRITGLARNVGIKPQ